MTPGRPRHITTNSDDGLLHVGAVTLFGVVVGTEVASKTLTLHDAAAEADAAAENIISVIKLDSRGSYQFGTHGARFALGMVAVLSSSTTTDVTIITS